MASYRQLVRAAELKRLQVTEAERKKISKIFQDVAKDYGKQISSRSSRNINSDYLLGYAKELKANSRYIYADVQKAIKAGCYNTARAVTGAQMQFWGNINPTIYNRVADTMTQIPISVVNEISSGQLYKDGRGLSSRLWRCAQAYERDIDYIIERGIIERKPALELAYDLEKYLNPGVEKPWEWRKVYPGSNKIVDYSAQRLARTSVTHAYQMAFVRSTKDNPFIVSYQWHASNSGRVCPLCEARDGKIYKKDEVPLDHPNGMCTISAVIEKSYNEIADDIADWVNGGKNPGLDKWLG